MKAFFLTLLLVATAHAGISTTGGITLVKEGGTGHSTASNLAIGKTAFAKDEFAFPTHAIAKVNDGLFGNSNSWIGATQNSFVGINLGAAPVAVRSFAFGRDVAGGFTDRHLGLYELEYTTVPNPNQNTTSWTSLGTMNYQSAGGARFASPAVRHVFNLPTTVMATGIRLKVNATTVFDLTCVDELELYAEPFLELVEEGGLFMTNNLASGKRAFAKDHIGIAPHAVANLNDGYYGNSYSWIAGSDSTFIGINLGTLPVTLSRVAWGRDNTGTANDRWSGLYTLQYTTTPNPDALTPEQNWTTVGSVNYGTLPVTGNFSAPRLRHLWSFGPVQATGFRIKINTTGSFAANVAIDELELYDEATSTPAPNLLTLLSGGKFYSAPGGTDAYTIQPTVAGVTRIFTVRNGTAATVPLSLSLSGVQAASFTLNTGNAPATLAPGASTTFTITHATTAQGNTLSATLKLASGATEIDLLLQATALDITPPVIPVVPLQQVTMNISSGTTVVNYPTVTAVDDTDPTPVVTFNPPSGSSFTNGVHSVTITATDLSGNVSTRTMLVAVSPPPPVLVSQSSNFLTNNLATGKTAFGKDVIAAAPHAIANINNGTYGNPSSWLAATADSFVGINLGSTAVTVNKVAWGRDNGGLTGDRWAGIYVLQFTTTPNPDASTPESQWKNIGLVDYSSLAQTGNFTFPARRHLWSFTPVQATGIRLRVLSSRADLIGIDELEIYNETATETIPPTIAAYADVTTLVNATSEDATVTYNPAVVGDDSDPTPVVTYSHASGSVFPLGATQVTITATDASGNTATSSFFVHVTRPLPTLHQTGGTLQRPNFASTATAFAKDQIGVTPHAISNLNNGVYGNPASWIGGSANSFFGLNFGTTPKTVRRIAWGRDNNLQSSDRWQGIYTIQVTTVPNPSAATPEASWISYAALNYNALSAASTTFFPSRRHVWEIPPVSVTGIRIKTQSTGQVIAIDELEAYDGTEVEATPPVITPLANMTATAASQGGIAVTFPTITAVDNADPSPVVTTSPASGSIFLPGLTTVTITATDANGNSATSTFTVTVSMPELVLVEAGGQFYRPNLAATAIAFAQNEIGIAPHAISNLNDGIYGNTNSWIAGALNSFIGLNFGATPVSINRIAFSRDNTGATLDRWQGLYTLQFTTVPNPSAATPDSSWASFPTLNYRVLAESSSNFIPRQRNMWSFPTLSVTGIRIRIQTDVTSIQEMAIDELEAYGSDAVETIPPVVTPPLDSVVQASSMSGIAVTHTGATATDNEDPAPQISYSPVNGSVLPAGLNTITVIATDANGNSSTSTFTVNVHLPAPTLYQTGETFSTPNLATTATAFAKDVIVAPPHAISKINDGVYGNPSSWIGGSGYSFFGLNFGSTPRTVRRIAWGRDNTVPTSDRWQGFYTLQITTTPNPSNTTPETSWISYATLNYDALAASTTFFPSLRHVWEISTVSVTGIRIITESTGQIIAIDELEAYDGTEVEGTPPVITPVANMNVTATSLLGRTVAFPTINVTDNADPAPVVTTSPVSGSFFSPGTTTVTITATDASGNSATSTFTVTVTVILPAPTLVETGGGFLKPNLATTATAFAQNEIGVGPHAISKVNDGIYGNSSSWIGGTADSFIGLNFGASPVTINRIAFGRDNTAPISDRWQGLYSIQFTTVPNPSAATPDASWTSFVALDYNALAAASSSFKPSRRHLWSFPSLSVTGIRIKTQSTVQEIAIDELEAYGSSAVDATSPVITPPTTFSVPARSHTGTAVTYPAITVTDNTDPAPVISFSPPSGSLFPLGSSTVTVTATDAQNNSSTATFTVNVLAGVLQQIFGTAAPSNHGLTATAFAKDEVGIAPHAIGKLNDGLSGNENSWIAGSLDSFAGLSFGAATRPVLHIAFGRDNTGVSSDRSLGLYTLQYTTVHSPSASTPEASWITADTIDYTVLAAADPFFFPARRHVWKLPGTLQATGIRVKCLSPGQPIAIDELEAYDDSFTGTSQLAIFSPNLNVTNANLNGTWVTYPAPRIFGSPSSSVVTYDPPNGSFFTLGTSTVTASVTDGVQTVSNSFTVTVTLPPPSGGDRVGHFMRSGNLAPLGTAFAQNVASGVHSIAKVNDGLYGDANAWRAATDESFVGISFGNTPRLVTSAAWGRDNIRQTFDGTAGDFTIQITTVPNPDANTPDSAWIGLPQLLLPTAHRIFVSNDDVLQAEYYFSPMLITGFRLRVHARSFSSGNYFAAYKGTIAIDELCLYGPEGTPQEQWKALHFGSYTPRTANLDDFDGDGIKNLLEFAFGTTPTSSTSGSSLSHSGNTITRGQPTNTATTALYIRRKDHAAAGITYTPTFSNNLTTWAPSVATPTVVADDGTYEVLSVPFPVNQTTQFFRVAVE